jgi:hypothetical protein
MKSVLGCLLLALSLLLLSGTSALCESKPASPPLKLLHGPAQARSNARFEDIRDIKGPVPLPDNTRFLIPAAAVSAAVIIAGLIFLYLKKRRKPQAPPLPPDVVALSELDRAKNLMTPEQCLVYAQRISTILRHYIESRFQIRSTRQTTREFFDRLKNGTSIAEVDIKNHAGDLQKCLEQCDIAKFAHGTPNNDDMMQMDNAARGFIETTRRNQEPGTHADTTQTTNRQEKETHNAFRPS